MRTPRKPESPAERDERLKLDAQKKRALAEAEDATVDRLIRESVQLYGA